MWRSCNEWSQADKDKYNKEAKETNKVWGEKNEKERREKVANALDLEKNKAKINQYNQRPEVKAKNQEYAQRPEVKARRKNYFINNSYDWWNKRYYW